MYKNTKIKKKKKKKKIKPLNNMHFPMHHAPCGRGGGRRLVTKI
jgi:hypothetical protein